jgi:hypothetical protein
LGFDGRKTIVDDYVREIRPLFATPRTYQRTVYRPGEICQRPRDLIANSGRGEGRHAPPGAGRRRGPARRARRERGRFRRAQTLRACA